MVATLIRPATFKDVREMPLEIGYTLEAPETIFESEKWFQTHAVALERDEQLIGVFGVKTIGWEGVGHCFAFIHPDAKRYKKTLVVKGRDILQICLDRFDYWRLQATVEAKFTPGVNYLLALGFSIDGLMPMFGPDRSDHLMMSKVING